VAVQHGDDILDTFDDAMIRVRPEVAEGIAGELEEATGGKVWFSASSGTIYVSSPSQRGLDAVAQLEMAIRTEADEETISRLVDEIAMASTRGSGNRVVLGAWGRGGEYISEAVEHDGVFFDTGGELWEALEESGLDPFAVNEAFLRKQLEAGVERIDFVSGDIDAILREFAGSADEDVLYRAKELR
jgi:hypothetical protein